MEKAFITVSRHWNNPRIYSKLEFSPPDYHPNGGNLDEGSINLAIELDDFINALCTEIGSVTFVLTQAQLKKKVLEATARTIDKVKQESSKIINNK